MTLSHFQKLLLRRVGPYVGAGVVLMILLFVVGGDISSRVETILQQRSSLAVKSQSIESLASLRSEFDSSQPYFSFLENILPPRDRMISFSKDLEGFAKKYNLGFGFTFGNETPSTEVTPGTIDFRLTIQGSYDNLIGFLKSVESSRYFVSFTNFEVSQKLGAFEILIDGKVFSQ